MVKEVERYVEKLASPQREVVIKLRRIILETLPNTKEELWMGVPFYDRRFYIVALGDHVNLGFSVKGLSERERGSFEGRGKVMRHLKFHSLEEVDGGRVARLLRMVADKDVPC